MECASEKSTFHEHMKVRIQFELSEVLDYGEMRSYEERFKFFVHKRLHLSHVARASGYKYVHPIRKATSVVPSGIASQVDM